MTLIQADALHLPYPSNYFHAIVTSPPYWGLRKYAGEQGEEPLGLEATPERHIERMVEVFREVRRVLRDDGVVWLNYGDCFAGSGGENANTGLTAGKHQYRMTDDKTRSNLYRNNPRREKIAQGNLMLMPHRLAIALQADGWIVRNDLVWFKRNPMPESVSGWKWEHPNCKCGKKNPKRGDDPEESMTGDGLYTSEGSMGNTPWSVYDPDCSKCHGTGKVGEPVLRKSSWRHTRAHEYVFMLVKNPKYYCNQEAVREEALPASHKRASYGYKHIEADDHNRYGDGFMRSDGKPVTLAGRNPRSVLDVPTAPYKGAHYATFPPKLIAPLIRASVPRRCCPECGMAWAPVVEKQGGLQGSWHDHSEDESEGQRQGNKTELVKGWFEMTRSVTDYRPTCECGIEEHEPGIVLDIFGGSGTTGAVAKQLLRRWVVMDISKPYLDEQAKVRTRSGTPSKALEGLPLFEDTE